jgi:hypothetical protein
MGVACVTLANNHMVDFGPDAPLDDTLEHWPRRWGGTTQYAT